MEIMEDGAAGHHDEEWDRGDENVDGEVEEGGTVEMTMITVETGTDIILCRPVLTRPSRSRHHAARAWPRHSHYTWKRTFSQSRPLVEKAPTYFLLAQSHLGIY